MRNGRVSGFAGSCVQLTSAAFVTDLMVSDCGRSGIAVSNGSIVTSNRVTRTGENGILMTGLTHPATFERNTVSLAGSGGGSFTAVSGGRPSGGNSCDDSSCRAIPRPRYYLTTDRFKGDHAAQVCAIGFHMASIFELLNPSNLIYDSSLGEVLFDSGSGPPSYDGWTPLARDWDWRAAPAVRLTTRLCRPTRCMCSPERRLKT